jgi:hypothetical protein
LQKATGLKAFLEDFEFAVSDLVVGVLLDIAVVSLLAPMGALGKTTRVGFSLPLITTRSLSPIWWWGCS